MPNHATPLLSVTSLTIQSKNDQASAPLVRNVSFNINAGDTLALIGESGSGKTLTSLALLGLLPKPLQQTGGEIRFDGKVLNRRRDFAKVRGAAISMIFQEPLAALNPVFRVGNQIQDVLKTHHKLPKGDIKNRILTLFGEAGLSDPERVYKAYPHQLSGGMAQRVMIAMALSCTPKLIIADEPTTALDALTQRKILVLISKLQKQYNFALLLISHDNALVAQMADSVIQMHAGQMVETQTGAEIVTVPL